MTEVRQGAVATEGGFSEDIVEKQMFHLEKEFEKFEAENENVPPSKLFREFVFKKIAQVQLEVLRWRYKK